MTAFFTRIGVVPFTMLCTLLAPISSYAQIRYYQNAAQQLTTNFAGVATGIGKLNVLFTSPAYATATYLLAEPDRPLGPCPTPYLAATAMFAKQIVLTNNITQKSYTLPLLCPSCQAQNANGYLYVGNEILRDDLHGDGGTCSPGQQQTTANTVSFSTILLVNLKDSNPRVPPGDYTAVVTASIGALGESEQGDYTSWGGALINAGLSPTYGGGQKITTPLTVISYTLCHTAASISFDYGSLNPDQVTNNKKIQPLTINCDGPATINLAMTTPRPQVGSGIDSHIQLSADNTTWADNLTLSTGNAGNKNVYLSSTLETTGAVIPQSINGSTIVTMDYQ